jgi:hypothetical protein
MDDHVRICEEMFSAARSEFKHLEYFYSSISIFTISSTRTCGKTIGAGIRKRRRPWISRTSMVRTTS